MRNLVPAWLAVVVIAGNTRVGTKSVTRNYLPATEETVMGFGRGALLWLLGVPLPIIILLAIFMHH
jgi:hypothetical protein